MEQARIKWIDMAKGCGIILVMISHFCGIPYIGNYIFGGYMQMFFILSGYTLQETVDKRFIRKRAERLLIPYFGYGILIIAVSMVYSFLKGDFHVRYALSSCFGLVYSRYSLYPDIGSENNRFFLTCYNSPFWFLTAMFVSYIWVYLYLRQKDSNKRAMCLLAFIGLTVVCTYIPVLLPWSIDTSFMGALLILSGYYMKKRNLLNNRIWKIIAVVLIYVSLVYINGNVNMSVREYGKIPVISCALFWIIGIMFTIILCGILQNIHCKVVEHVLTFIGKETVILLCCHLLLAQGLTPLLSDCNRYAGALIKIICVVSICSAVYVVKRKVAVIYEKKHIVKSGAGNHNGYR